MLDSLCLERGHNRHICIICLQEDLQSLQEENEWLKAHTAPLEHVITSILKNKTLSEKELERLYMAGLLPAEAPSPTYQSVKT